MKGGGMMVRFVDTFFKDDSFKRIIYLVMIDGKQIL